MAAKSYLVAALSACLAASTHASYELALLLQDFAPPSASIQRYVTRWDPISGAYLGGFRTLSLPSRLALHPSAPGTVDLADVSTGALTLRRMNYSTGITESVVNTGIPAVNLRDFRYLPDGRMLISGVLGPSERIRFYDGNGALLSTLTLPAGTNQAISAVAGPDGTIYSITRQVGSTSGSRFTLASHNSSGAIVNTALIADNTTFTFFDLDFAPNGYLHIGSALWSQRRSVPVLGTALGTVSPVLGWIEPASTYSMGHGDSVYGFGYDSTNSRMVLTGGQVTTLNGDFYSHVPGTTFRQVLDSAIVVAPEPASLFALSLGLLALRRRRA